MASYTVVLSADPGTGVYTVTCPAMPGAVTEGDSRTTALDAMAGVMGVWLELAQRDGYEPRPETHQLVASALGAILGDREEMGWPLVIETSTLAPIQSVAA